MNRPAGQAKTRRLKGKSTKPYVERDDGESPKRLAAAVARILALPPDVAAQIRKQSKG